MKILRTDTEKVFNSSDVQLFLDEQGTKSQSFFLCEHYQNSVERLIQHNVREPSSLMYSLLGIRPEFPSFPPDGYLLLLT